MIIGKNYGFLSKSSINQQPFNEILYINTHKKKIIIIIIMASMTDVSSQCMVFLLDLELGSNKSNSPQDTWCIHSITKTNL